MEQQNEKRTWSPLGELAANDDPETAQAELRDVEHAFRRGYHHSWVVVAHLVKVMAEAGIKPFAITTLLAIAEEKIIAPWRENLASPDPVPQIDLDKLLLLYDEEQLQKTKEEESA